MPDILENNCKTKKQYHGSHGVKIHLTNRSSDVGPSRVNL